MLLEAFVSLYLVRLNEELRVYLTIFMFLYVEIHAGKDGMHE
jgi:hypothetical protein